VLFSFCVDAYGVFMLGLVLRVYLVLMGLLGAGVMLVMLVGHQLPTDMLVFTSDRDGSTHQIYIMDVNRELIVRLSNNGNTNTSPRWSRDGRVLAWLQGGDNATFWAYTFGETQAQPLTDLLISAPTIAWSPNEHSFLFERTAPNGWKNILLLDATTQTVTALTDNNRLHESAPSWSADGTQFVYSYQDNVANNRVAIFDIASTQSTNLSEDEAVFPSWSPNGEWIAYITEIGANQSVVIMHLDGTARREITVSQAITYVQPVWSPNSQKVLFEAEGILYLYHMENATTTVLTPNFLSHVSPSWSSDSVRIVVAENSAQRPETRLVVINTDTQERTQITHGRFNADRMPDWRPQG
jgi:Tol biopolymer transport system component